MSKKEKGKKLKKVIATFLSCAFVACAFSACNNAEIPPVKSGIEVVDDTDRTYSQTSRERAKTILYNGIEQVFILATNKTELSQSEKESALKHAVKIESVVVSKNLSQSAYKEFFGDLEQNQDEYVGAIIKFRKGEQNQETLQTIKKALTSFTATMGAETTGSILYDLAVYSFEQEREKALLDYEKYGYAYLLENADTALKNKQTLVDDIKEENFISLVKLSFFLGELFFGGGMDSSILSSFSDQEILLLLNNPDFSNISIGKDGWKLILNGVYGSLEVKSYHKALKRKADENGNLDKFCEKLNLVIDLVCAIQNDLTESDVQFIRKGEKEKLITSCFKNFSEEEWAKFQALTSVQIANSDYDDIALSYFGREYQTFKEQISSVSFIELRGAVEGENFMDKLINYLTGLCPAFYYGVNL